MTKQVQRRRGTAAQHTSFTGAEGEISVNTTNKSVHVHDGTTAGGVEAARADLDNVSSASVLSAAGLTATATELNYTDGVTSPIQTQLDAKAPINNATFTGTTVIPTADINGGTIDGVTIGASAAPTVTNIDINGGTIDGTVIGGSTPAAISGTTINGTTGNFTASGAISGIFNRNTSSGATLQIQVVGNNVGTLGSSTDGQGRLDIAAQTALLLRAGASQFIGFEADGSERMRITSTGSVGIGTSSPTHNLTVGGTAASDFVVALRGGVGGFFGWDDSANSTILQSPNTRSLAFQVNSDTFSAGTEAMRITSTGNVGIGLTNPGVPLHVKGKTNGNVMIVDATGTAANYIFDVRDDGTSVMRVDPSGNLLVGGTTAGNAGTVSINVGNAGATAGGLQMWAGTSQTSFVQFGDESGTAANHYRGYIAYAHGSDSMQFGTASTERMRIDASGNVGLGTSSIASLGTNVRTLHLNDVQGSGIRFAANGINYSYIFGGSTTLDIATGTTIPMTFTTNNTERMRITSTGSVGIGTSSPGVFGVSSQNVTIGNATGYAFLQLQGSSGNGGAIDFGDTSVRHAEIASLGGTALAFYMNATNSGNALTERMRIDASGNVGIGATAPSSFAGGGLTLGSSSSGKSLIINSSLDGSNGVIQFVDSSTNNAFQINAGTAAVDLFGYGSRPMLFSTNGTERARIDASGNLLVGKTSTGLSNVGFQVLPSGVVGITRSGSNPLDLNRLSSDGTLIEFNKDGTTVGSIGTASSRLAIGTSNVGAYFASGGIAPWNTTTNAARDNAIDLGSGSARFKNLYLSGGVYLGGTGSANLLDDYEEGTYTPTIQGSATAGSRTYIEQTGRYTKIGNMVRFSGSIQFNSNSGATGTMVISLPFATLVAAAWQGNFTLGYQSSFGAIGYTGYTDPGRADFFIRKDGTASANIQGDEMPTGGHVIFGGTFETGA